MRLGKSAMMHTFCECAQLLGVKEESFGEVRHGALLNRKDLLQLRDQFDASEKHSTKPWRIRDDFDDRGHRCRLRKLLVTIPCKK